MLVEDVMTPHPVTTTAGATIQQALVLLDTYCVTSLPVVDTAGGVVVGRKGVEVGVLSRSDVVHVLARADVATTSAVAEALEPS